MKKPAGVTKEQWAKYKGDLELALKVMNKALDVVADANFLAGEQVERERIIKLLESNNKLCTEKTVCIEANEGYPCLCTDLIELIKGEQK